MIKSLIKKAFVAFRGGLLHIFFGSIFTRAVGFIASVVVINYISKEEYAYLSYATNIYSYLDLLAGLGICLAMLKYCSSNNNIGKNTAFLKFALLYSFSIDLLLVVIVNIAVTVIDIPFPEARLFFRLLSVFQIMIGLRNILQVYLRTELKNKLYAVVGFVNAVLVLAVGFVGVRVLDAMGYVIAQYIGTIAAMVICVISIRKSIKKAKQQGEFESTKLSFDELKPFIIMGISLMIANLFSEMMSINETFLVNNIIKDEIITSNFKVAGLIPAQLKLISGAITIYYFPIVAKNKPGVYSWRLCRNIGLVVFGLVSLATIIGLLFTPFIIRIVYGDKYLDSINMSYMLWAMRAVNFGIRAVPMNMLPALGKTKFNAWCAFVSCVVLTAIDYFVLENIGIEAIAYGAFIVFLISGVAFWIYLYKVCHSKVQDIVN